MSYAKGEYLSFLDEDDIFEIDNLEELESVKKIVERLL